MNYILPSSLLRVSPALSKFALILATSFDIRSISFNNAYSSIFHHFNIHKTVWYREQLHHHILLSSSADSTHLLFHNRELIPVKGERSSLVLFHFLPDIIDIFLTPPVSRGVNQLHCKHSEDGPDVVICHSFF